MRMIVECEDGCVMIDATTIQHYHILKALNGASPIALHNFNVSAVLYLTIPGAYMSDLGHACYL